MKRETVEEFLARGGIIKKIPIVQSATKEVVKALPAAAASFITMEEAELYSEAKNISRKKTFKKEKQLDISVLPKELLDKFIKDALDGQE
jgi:hypothetical protein